MYYVCVQKSFHTGQYLPKRAGMTETDWYGLEFISRWNKGASNPVLLAGTVFSDRNGTESTTLFLSVGIVFNNQTESINRIENYEGLKDSKHYFSSINHIKLVIIYMLIPTNILLHWGLYMPIF